MKDEQYRGVPNSTVIILAQVREFGFHRINQRKGKWTNFVPSETDSDVLSNWHEDGVSCTAEKGTEEEQTYVVSDQDKLVGIGRTRETNFIRRVNSAQNPCESEDERPRLWSH